jgi:hypothetical protein
MMLTKMAWLVIRPHVNATAGKALDKVAVTGAKKLTDYERQREQNRQQAQGAASGEWFP